MEAVSVRFDFSIELNGTAKVARNTENTEAVSLSVHLILFLPAIK